MKIKLYGLILIFILLTSFLAKGQEKPEVTFRNKISLGGWIYDSKYLSVFGSYSLLKNRENEICFSLWYLNCDRSEIIFGASYYYSIFKKKSRFDLFIAGELNFNYDWYNYIDSDIKLWHFGPFLGLGIIPTYNISNRLSLSFEINLGFGYQWGTQYDYTLSSGRTYHHSESGDYGLTYRVLKLNYKF